MFFYLFLLFLLLQRGVELAIAKRNERWMLAEGAHEVGSEHYKYILLMHLLFFCSLLFEVTYWSTSFTWWSYLLFSVFLLIQALRIWCLLSLGKFWNTKIIVLPQTEVIQHGPYRYMRHPNYLVVTLEILIVPLIFQAYFTAIFFSLLNAYLLLCVRIPQEEEALQAETNYSLRFQLKKN